jgi:transcription initiation factor TFIIIB Brf1 subunit/transcription initiation factor TFIIB
MATTERLRDPMEIADAADLPEQAGNYARMILERLERQGYQKPDDGRTYPAVVYVAARDEGVPVTVNQVADAAGVEETAVGREYKRVVSNLDLDGLELVGATEFIDRFADSLDLDEGTRRLAVELYQEGETDLFAARSPSVSAAACLYAAARLTDADVTQDEFETFGVSEVSIRKTYRDVLALRDETPENSQKMTSEDTDTLLTAVEQVHKNVENVPDGLLGKARDAVTEVEGAAFLDGKSPEPVAAAIYWLIAEDNRVDVTQEEVASAAETHKVTVNRRVSDVRSVLDGK